MVLFNSIDEVGRWEVRGAFVFALAFLACHSERSERTCFLPFFVRLASNDLIQYPDWLTHSVWGDTDKKREEAGSLAALGMTSQKGKSKGVLR
jgi:hypothetical protein